MKLFYVIVMDDTEQYIEIVVASSKEKAEEKVLNMEHWDCVMWIKACEIDVVEDYKINIKKCK